MKSITSILAALAIGTTLSIAADEKPAAGKPEAAAAKPEAGKPAAGAEKPKHDPAEMFKKLDKDGDGKIDKAEWEASPMAKKDAAKAAEMFTKRDKDGDGKLSMEEFSAEHGKKNK